MTFTVDDFQDLIRLLEQRPEWRAELRRHVLSEELLELPAVVRQLAEQLIALTARLDRLAEQLETAIDRLVEAQGRTETRVGRLEGDLLELRYARRGPAYFSRLARRLRVIDPGALADLLDEAVAEGRLAETERDAVLEADLVFAGRRREDGAEVYLLAEISAGIRPHDVERAAERAALLQKLGRPVTPIVAGWQINAEAAILAAERGVVHVLNGQVARPLTS